MLVNELWYSFPYSVLSWSTYLLKHLIDVCKNRPVQVPVLVGSKAISEASLSHLEDSVFDSIELALDFWVVFR